MNTIEIGVLETGGSTMSKANGITLVQFKELSKLRYRGAATGYIHHKPKGEWFFVPTCDEVIEWLRVKHNVLVFHAVPPFVDPSLDGKNEILHRLCIKFCNRRDGWNGREIIGKTDLNKNLNTLKRQAIAIAIKWLLKRKKQQNKKNGRNSHN